MLLKKCVKYICTLHYSFDNLQDDNNPNVGMKSIKKGVSALLLHGKVTALSFFLQIISYILSDIELRYT